MLNVRVVILPLLTAAAAAIPAGCANTDHAMPTSSPAVAPGAQSDQSDQGFAVASFDEAVTYQDGVKVEIKNVEHREFSAFDVGAQPGDDVTSFTIKITNGSRRPFETTLVSPTANYGPDGVGARPVFTAGAGPGFTGAVLPGKAMSADFAFAIPADDLDDATVQIGMGQFEKGDAIFSGSLG